MSHPFDVSDINVYEWYIVHCSFAQNRLNRLEMIHRFFKTRYTRLHFLFPGLKNTHGAKYVRLLNI